MSRLLPLPERSSVAEAEIEQYDAIVQRQKVLWSGLGMDSNAYFGALLNSPPLAAALGDLGKVVRQSQLRGSFSDAEREFVDMVLTVDFGYWTIGLLHLPDAIAVGVRIGAVDALLSGNEADLNAEEIQLTDFVRNVVNGGVTDDAYFALQARLGARGALEFTGFVGFLICTFRLWQALGVADVGRDEFAALLDSIRDGTVELPDPSARQG
jgi:hypothetical protein